MRKLILIVHTSLDGFVAGPKGEMDDFDASEENLRFVCELTNDADTALFGRTSYQLLESYWPKAHQLANASKGTIDYSGWYNNASKIVISNTMTNDSANKVTIINQNIFDAINEVKKQPGKNILLFGSPSVAQVLMQQNLIDEYWVFVNPAIFGKGIPLFKEQSNKIKLELLSTKQFTNGEFGLHYRGR